MLRWWTELLPVFLFKRLARNRCGTYPWNEVAWHDARPGIAIRDERSWMAVCTRTFQAAVRDRGITFAEEYYGHFPVAAKQEATKRYLMELVCKKEAS